MLINKETGEIENEIKEKINNETGEKIYIKNDIKNKQLISIKDEETGKENLIDKETGEKEDNLEIKIKVYYILEQ